MLINEGKKRAKYAMSLKLRIFPNCSTIDITLLLIKITSKSKAVVMIQFDPVEVKELLTLFNETERERCWKILTAIISQDWQKFPGKLTAAEAKATQGLSYIYHKTQLQSIANLYQAQYEIKNNGYVVSTLESNLWLRSLIISYASDRTAEELKDYKDAKAPEAIQLSKESKLFHDTGTHLITLKYNVMKARQSISKRKIFGNTIKVIAGISGAALGLIKAAVVITPFFMFAPPLIAGLVALSITPILVSSLSSVGHNAVNAALVSPLLNRFKRNKTIALGDKLSDKIEEYYNKVSDNPKQVEKIPLDFIKTISSSRLGFFARRQYLPEPEPDPVEPRVAAMNLPMGG